MTEPQDEALASLHLTIQDMLAGYVDDELTEQEQTIVNAHLSGCQQCQADVKRQILLQQQCQQLPIPEISNAQLTALEQKIATEVTHSHADAWAHRCQQLIKPPTNLSIAWATSGWVTAMVLAVVLMLPLMPSSTTTDIPMLKDAIADYQTVINSPFKPVSQTTNQAALWPKAELLSSWQTNIGGKSATGYAIRSGQHIVFQYQIEPVVFYRNDTVRNAVEKSGSYHTQVDHLTLLALPRDNSGIIMLGPKDALPSATQIAL